MIERGAAKSAAGGGESARLPTEGAVLGPRRHPRNELFVLGELAGGPHHGYLLREILNRALGPFWQMSWGALYPLIHDLEREGLIVADVDEAVAGGSMLSGHWRRPYRITEAGRERFQVLMREHGAYTVDYPDLFTIKLNLFHHIGADVQLAILQHGRAFFAIVADYLDREEQYVLSREGIPPEELPSILRFVHFRLSGVQAQLAWIEGEIARRAPAESA